MLISLYLKLLFFGALINAREEKENGPKISKTKLENPVSNLFYFEDSDVALIHDREDGKILRTANAGAKWEDVDDIAKGAAWDLLQHPYDHKVAYVLGGETKHWVTHDRGESWREFETKAPPSLFHPPLSWHADDSDRVLFHGQKCRGLFNCQQISYYTTDGFKSTKEMRKDTKGCTYARSTPQFEGGKDNTVLCVVLGRHSPWPADQRLVVSDNYFEKETEPQLEGDRTVQGIINIAPVKGFIVAAAKAEGTRELAMYVTKDASTWHRAVFPSDHKLEEDAYTILESTNYSIQVDVMTTAPSHPMGVLFTSNSNGTYFTRNIEHTNRNFKGLVDFEKIQGIQGIALINQVENWEKVEKLRQDKRLQSKISFDDGRTYNALKAGKDGKEELHLHSVTEMSNVGRVFSSPAPGLAMGIGNTGDFLKAYEEGDLWVSNDAGVSWSRALKEAHKYEFGDQGSILVAIYDEGPTDELKYSLDHGREWKTAKLGVEVRAKVLTTVLDSTTLKFILLATTGKGSDTEHVLLSLDFNGLHERECGEKDFEKWYARLDEKGKPDCLMGHKQYFNRRKADVDCFVKDKFREPEAKFEPCTCTKEDYECDYNFKKDGDKCKPAGVLPVPEGACKEGDETFMGSSGFRLIPGNDCDPKEGADLDKEEKRPCDQAKETPVSGEISHELSSFKAEKFRESFYFERAETSTGVDETIIMRTSEQKIYRTVDHGKNWEHILKGEEITAIYPNHYFNDWVFFLTSGKKVFYSRDRGERIEHFEAPTEPTHDRLQVLSFHPDYPNWFIWTGAKDCEKKKGDCHSVAYLTTDRGDLDWNDLLRYVRKCEFIKKEGRGDSEKLVYCEQYKDESLDKPLQLVSSDNWFADSKVQFSSVIDFATMSEFIIVATKDQQDEKSLKVDASVDGKTFADAEFPNNFHVPVQKAYTVLDSSTHAVFLHVTVGSRENFEYGSIVKSNSNGTSYVLSLDGVNRNTPGFVDFEKALGLEGVALANVVDNIEAADKGQTKKLKTLISHNDGAEWTPLQAPKEDSEGNAWGCDIEHPEKCSIHLHGYTERKDPRDTFSSPTAVGFMMGVGNVGEHLGKKVDEDNIYTFLTSDGGITWRAVRKGNYMWEYGDQGSIIVIVQEKAATDVIYYSLDEGITWIPYKFTNSKMEIESITTVPSDNSRNFLLWGRIASSSNEISTVNIDFTGMKERSKQCTFDSENPENPGDDYHLWFPKHPLSEDDCLFGHITQYVRKNPEANCYNGRKLPNLDPIKTNCSCTRRDFEW